ncbi:unnamed protein product [Allacma fusca]|uniref:Carboxylic ester hydrolase n=1 Tax=Allacma fusca TaxID=39272 RepID=A0A8J2JH52_9HEXA|nr:unnamed protein product [Allacma fusca]
MATNVKSDVLEQTEIYKLPSPIVITNYGRVQGVRGCSRQGREYYKFLGVPYAAPPVGNLRFEPPEPPASWRDVKLTNKFSPECAQMEIMATGRILGKEDCLYLNVFTPKLLDNAKKLLPVMVYIYGGLFMAGSADLYNGDYFMDEDVVLVTLNYRVAALGFLNTGDEVVRGNMGLKDQLMALKWVQANIRNFGGDPKQVTIFGESAGGASVHYHMLSHQSEGLFHKAISQSADSLVRFHRAIMYPLHRTEDAFLPTIETVEHDDRFLVAHPLELMRNGSFSSVPWMAGVTSDEGLYLIARLLTNKTVASSIGPKWNDLVPLLLNYHLREDNEETATKIPIQEHLRKGSVYLYHFSYKSKKSLFPLFRVASEDDYLAAEIKLAYVLIVDFMRTYVLKDPFPLEGACHADDLPLLFNFHPLVYIRENSEHYQMSKEMVNTWASFAQDKVPLKFNGVTWPLMKPGETSLQFLNLSLPGGIIDSPLRNVQNFWKSLNLSSELAPHRIYSDL